MSSIDEIEGLKRRIAELEVENDELRARLTGSTPSAVHKRRIVVQAILDFIARQGEYPRVKELASLLNYKENSLYLLLKRMDGYQIEIVSDFLGKPSAVADGVPRVLVSSSRYVDQDLATQRRSEIWEVRNQASKAKAKARNQAKRQKSKGQEPTDFISEMHRSQQGLCWWCSRSLGDKYEIDHRVSLAKGGTDTPGNRCLSCEDCNSKKRAKTPGDFNGRLL